MTDQFDRAQELEQMTRDIALQKPRTFKAVSRLYCEDCDIPIPEKTSPINSRRNPLRGLSAKI